MYLLDILKKIICSSCKKESTKTEFINKINEKPIEITSPLESSNKVAFAPITIADTRVIKPLTSQEISEMRLCEIEEDEIDDDALEYIVYPLPSTDRLTLVLDLDNTLIYASTKELKIYDHKFTVNYNGKMHNVWIIERPGLANFIDLMSKYYDLVLFTAGIKQYGIKVLKKIDPKCRLNYFLDRRFCTFLKRNSKDQDLFAKNVSILGRDESKILLVDDRVNSFALNMECGILVSSFDGDLNDKCLERLGNFLVSCANLSDLRYREVFTE